MNIPSLPSNLESSTLFLNKFSCASEEISRNYRPAMNIHNDRTLRIRGHVYSRRGRVWMSRDGFNWISNRKRIVKTRFGYALFEGRCFAKRWKTWCMCACILGTLCHYCYHFLFLWSRLKGDERKVFEHLINQICIFISFNNYDAKESYENMDICIFIDFEKNNKLILIKWNNRIKKERVHRLLIEGNI